MQSAYAQAVIQEPFTVLGRRLKPFSIGHSILLTRFDSAFAPGSGRSPEFEDLILSVLICSHDFDGAVKALSSRLLPIKLRAWGWLFGKFDVFQKLRMFRAYVDQGMREPLFWHKAEGGNMGAPYEQHLLNWLISRGVSESDALNYPYSKAVWAYATDAEHRGAITLWTDRDYRDTEKLKQMQARMEANNVAHN